MTVHARACAPSQAASSQAVAAHMSDKNTNFVGVDLFPLLEMQIWRLRGNHSASHRGNPPGACRGSAPWSLTRSQLGTASPGRELALDLNSKRGIPTCAPRIKEHVWHGRATRRPLDVGLCRLLLRRSRVDVASDNVRPVGHSRG